MVLGQQNPNKWHLLVEQPPNVPNATIMIKGVETLNEHLNRHNEEPWETRWKRILGSDLTRRSKLFLKRIVMNSMYNMARVQQLGHDNGCCPLYLGQCKKMSKFSFNVSKHGEDGQPWQYSMKPTL